MKLNYMVLCYKDLGDGRWQVKHRCCYENKPTQVDFDSLQVELLTDPDFGMVDDDDYEMILCDRAEDPFWFEQCDIPEEIEE